jgi:hypothetical protein
MITVADGQTTTDSGSHGNRCITCTCAGILLVLLLVVVTGGALLLLHLDIGMYRRLPGNILIRVQLKKVNFPSIFKQNSSILISMK